jgi:predicted nucleic acid-binding protein
VPLRDNKMELAAVYLELLAPEGPLEILPVSRQILLKSAEIRANSAAKPIDAIHIATAMTARSDVFISDDRRLNPTPIRKITLEELARG